MSWQKWGRMKVKKCSKCKQQKNASEFNKNKQHKDGLRSYCRACDREFQKEYYKRNSDKRKKYWQTQKGKNAFYKSHLRSHYNLTLDDYAKMLKQQNGVCAICGESETTISSKTGTIKCLAVDHNHKTGKNRGLLCGRCNQALGLFQENPQILTLAALYLRRHQ